MQVTAPEVRPARRSERQNATGLPDGLSLVGGGARPSEEQIERALHVMAAVPLAAAAGWSVNGHPWTCHPRRLRTAIVRPSGEWDIAVMRGVREVDCLAGPMILRQAHLDRLETQPEVHRFRVGRRDDDQVRSLSRAFRGSGFRLLLLGES